eukprot:3073411-Pleurochrysis_carterae.AAC.1
MSEQPRVERGVAEDELVRTVANEVGEPARMGEDIPSVRGGYRRVQAGTGGFRQVQAGTGGYRQ